MMANDRGLDFERIRPGCRQDYPRAADMPGAGFAAGPCLFKDTMQLAAFNDNNFALGHAAMLVNEGLPLYLVSAGSSGSYDLADHDRRHPRHGVQGRVRRHPVEPVLQAQAHPRVQGAARCSCTDPYVTDRRRPACRWSEVLEQADLLVVGDAAPGVPRSVTDKPVADVWDVLGKGCAYD